MGKRNKKNVKKEDDVKAKGLSDQSKTTIKKSKVKIQEKPLTNGNNKQNKPGNKDENAGPKKVMNGVKKQEPKVNDKAKGQPKGDKKKNKNNAPAKTANNQPKTKAKKATAEATAASPEVVTKVSKRIREGVKCEMRKELIMKGKDPATLQKENLLQNKLKKLLAKPEPRSVKAQQKILVIQKLLKSAVEKKSTGKTVKDNAAGKNDSAKNNKKGSDSKNKNEQQKTVVLKCDDSISVPKDKFTVFVGNLPINVTVAMIREALHDVEGIFKIKLPKARKQKSRRFCYIQFQSEELKLEFFKKHGTMIGDKPINILYANKKKGKQITKVAEQQKSADAPKITDEQAIAIAKKLKNKNNKDRKKKLKAIKRSNNSNGSVLSD